MSTGEYALARHGFSSGDATIRTQDVRRPKTNNQASGRIMIGMSFHLHV